MIIEAIQGRRALTKLLLVQISSEASVFLYKGPNFHKGVTVQILLDIILGSNKMILCYFLFVQRSYGIEFSYFWYRNENVQFRGH